jgi:hypothetical protein
VPEPHTPASPLLAREDRQPVPANTSRIPSPATHRTTYNIMSPPQAKSPPSKSGVTRTRTGCWTCRARRKKCDETRPSCLACRSLNLQCEGYGVRLKWAIRGRPCVTFRHAHLRKPKSKSPEVKMETPVSPISLPSVSLGDCENEKDQVLLQYLGWEVFTSLSRFERDVLYDCKPDRPSCFSTSELMTI